MLGRVWNLVWKETIQFLRHRLLLIFVLVFPVWNLSSVAGSIAEGIMHIPTAVCDQDRSTDSRRIVAMLRNSRRFDPDYYVGSQAELEQLLERGTVKVGLVIPPDFGTELSLSGDGATIQMLLDGTEIMTSIIAQAYLEGMSYKYMQRMLGDELGRWSVDIEELDQVEVRSRAWFNETLREENYRLPGEMACVMALLAIFLPAVAIVRERETGTLEQLFVSPIRPIELIVGKSLLALLIAYLGFLGMLALNVLHFHVPFRGSLTLLMILTGYYIFVELGWGLVLSVVAKTQGQALLGAFSLIIVETILSGQSFPVEYMPRAAQAASYLVPARYYTVIVRNIMLKGSSLADLWPQVVALGVLGVVLYALAAVCLRKRLD